MSPFQILQMKLLVLCVLAHQDPGVQALEAQALQLTTDPEARNPEDDHGSSFMKSFTWTGLAVAKENSVAKTNHSSEISEEHIVIHLQPVDDWEDDQAGTMTSLSIMDGSQESEATKSSVSGPANFNRLENQGGSAHEEDGGSLNPPDPPTSPSVAPGTRQHQSSNSVLAEFVKSLMMPFRYLTGAEKAEKSQKGTSQLEENHTQEDETSSMNLSVPKAARKKGSVDNAIIERKNDGFIFWAPTAEATSPGEGLSEREKEAKPLVALVPLVPAVPRAGQVKSETGASHPLSSMDGKNSVFSSSYNSLLKLLTECEIKAEKGRIRAVLFFFFNKRAWETLKCHW